MEGRIGEGGIKARGLDRFRFTGKMEREVETEKKCKVEKKRRMI